MYIVVLENDKKKQSGYIVLQDKREYITVDGVEHISIDIDGNDYYIDSTDDCKNHIKCGSVTIDVIPFGEIAVQQYNKEASAFVNKGGLIAELNEKSTKLRIAPPHGRPIWFFNVSEKRHSTDDIITQLSELEPQQIHYLKTATITLGSDKRVLFEIEDLSELFDYDLAMIKKRNIPVDSCKFCGHAFIKTSKDVMCENCRSAGKGDTEKQDKWRQNPVNLEYAKLTNALRKRKGCGSSSNYYRWIGTQRENGVITEQWITQWRKVDKDYQKLCRYFSENGTTDVSLDLCQKWYDEHKKFPDQLDHPEKWVKEWMKKIQ